MRIPALLECACARHGRGIFTTRNDYSYEEWGALKGMNISNSIDMGAAARKLLRGWMA